MSTATVEELNLDTTPGDAPTSVNGVKGEELKRIIEHIENLEEQKKGISEDISLVKKEAKNDGFDVKTINEIVKLRKKDSHTIAEEQQLMDVYKRALGMPLD